MVNISFTMMSIDSSTKKTGYAIFNDGKLSYFDLICHDDNKIKMDDRFYKMSQSILKELKKYKPKTVFVEETVVVRNAQCQRFLTRLQGVIYGWCIQNNCEFTTLRPTEWRKLVGINSYKKKRPELKSEAIELVKKTYNIDVNDDVAEAILIGLAAMNLFRED